MENLLVGISIPQKITPRLTPLLHGLPNVDWAETETLHVFLATLKAHDHGQIREWIQAFENLRPQPCLIRLSGLEVQLSKKAKGHLWVLAEEVEGLTDVQHKLVQAADQGLGGLSITLAPKPHLRIGTILKGAFHHLTDYMSAHSLFSTEPFAVNTLWLFRPRTTSKRHLIEPVDSFPLGAEEEEILPPDAGRRPSDPRRSFLPKRPKPDLGNLFFNS